MSTTEHIVSSPDKNLIYAYSTPAITPEYYLKKIQGLQILAEYGIKELGGEHEKWNVMVKLEVPDEVKKLLESLGWHSDEDEDSWDFYCLV